MTSENGRRNADEITNSKIPRKNLGKCSMRSDKSDRMLAGSVEFVLYGMAWYDIYDNSRHKHNHSYAPENGPQFGAFVAIAYVIGPRPIKRDMTSIHM